MNSEAAAPNAARPTISKPANDAPAADAGSIFADADAGGGGGGVCAAADALAQDDESGAPKPGACIMHVCRQGAFRGTPFEETCGCK